MPATRFVTHRRRRPFARLMACSARDTGTARLAYSGPIPAASITTSGVGSISDSRSASTAPRIRSRMNRPAVPVTETGRPPGSRRCSAAPSPAALRAPRVPPRAVGDTVKPVNRRRSSSSGTASRGKARRISRSRTVTGEPPSTPPRSARHGPEAYPHPPAACKPRRGPRDHAPTRPRS